MFLLLLLPLASSLVVTTPSPVSTSSGISKLSPSPKFSSVKQESSLAKKEPGSEPNVEAGSNSSFSLLLEEFLPVARNDVVGLAERCATGSTLYCRWDRGTFTNALTFLSSIRRLQGSFCPPFIHIFSNISLKDTVICVLPYQ